MTNKIFYDSYAILEFLDGNDSFKIYFSEYGGITTLYNLMEVYYITLRDQGEDKAHKVLELLRPIIIYPTIEDVEESMKFKLENKHKKFSYTDCLGYVLARRNKIRFLTGDEGFKNFPNVEFVK
ncbi:type II toxin-antitoxin system VapC family toxin [Candidatus Woesearchaeota archaeon]|nr:type II toxin-antitoxin system VapC family toxin [Candidatus Woesearchaeota archaeon]